MQDNEQYSQVSSRKVQDSSDMQIGEGYDLGSNKIYEGMDVKELYKTVPGLKDTVGNSPSYKHSKQKHKTKISKFFSNMSRLGMNYDEQVINNMRAIPADKALLDDRTKLMNTDLFNYMSSDWKVKTNADKDFNEKDFSAKRQIFRNIALQPEIEDILDKIANEAIVYDSELVYFADPFIDPQDLHDFKSSIQDKINNSVSDNFRRFYKMLNWKYNAWDDFKRFLVEGELAWEIVYDDITNPTKIIGLTPVDVATLTRKFSNNKWYWVQYSGITGRERKLLDNQIVYISYQETKAINRISYIERLIRPFNIYRIIEQAQIIWTITNASYKTKFTIPVKGMNRSQGMQTLSMAMNRYKEDITFSNDTGELKVNGQVNLPFNKEYWFPESDSGAPNIENVGGDGPELNDNDQIKFFKTQLYKISNVPTSRFDDDNSDTWFGADAASVARVEINFSRFITRLRNQFSPIIIKPLQMQLALDIPELQDNRPFLESISLQYHAYNLFEELMEMDLMDKRVEFIQNMKDSMVDEDLEGNEIKFFSSKFLVQKYLKLSEADLKLNSKLKKEEVKKMNLAGDPDNPANDDSNESINPNMDKLVNMIMERLDKKIDEKINESKLLNK